MGLDIIIYGAGSIGSLLGGLLATEHEVKLVGRDPHMNAVDTHGLQITGQYQQQTWPKTTTDGTKHTADLAIVAVKTFDTKQAAEELATGQFDAILSVQNGIGNEKILAEHLSGPIFGGTTTFGARVQEPGTVQCTGIGEVTIGSFTPASDELVATIKEAFTTADIPLTVTDTIEAKLWEKAAINAGINPVTAILDVDNGAITTGPLREIAIQATTEATNVAQAKGIDISTEQTVQRLLTVAENTADNISSMRQDLHRGSQTEIDGITGTILEQGDAVGVQTPVNWTLYHLVTAVDP